MKEKRTRICVPVCVSKFSELQPAMTRAADGADFIEVRIDCVVDAENELANFDFVRLCTNSTLPVILTIRTSEQGGHNECSESDVRTFWLGLGATMLSEGEAFADIEIDLIPVIRQAGAQSHSQFMDRVICSHHDFTRVPTDLEMIYQRMADTNSRYLKIAVHANVITDCIPVFRLLDRARSDGREMIAIAMGNAGILTRILGPSRGSFLTYGSLEDNQKTAPGQIKAIELRDLYRIHDINEETQITGLIGEHVMHSVSPHIHNDAFATSGTNAVYIPFEVSALDDFIVRMVHPATRELDWNLSGLSITAPHKRSIIKHLDWIDPTAEEIGAVNTVVIKNRQLMGYNTDAPAAIEPLDGLMDLNEARVAVIGAGGAARALLWSLRKACSRVTVFARDLERGKAIATQFGAGCTALNDAVFDDFDLVVNTTPVGTRGLSEDLSPVNSRQFRAGQIAYDFVYNPIETRFLREATAAGCQTVNGIQMLVAQAARQFKLWTGNVAPLDVMQAAAVKALSTS